MSISPDAPDISEECKMEVRDFYVEQVSLRTPGTVVVALGSGGCCMPQLQYLIFLTQALDVRRDPPLIASCASELAGVCSSVTDPAKVGHLLRQSWLEQHAEAMFSGCYFCNSRICVCMVLHLKLSTSTETKEGSSFTGQ